MLTASYTINSLTSYSDSFSGTSLNVTNWSIQQGSFNVASGLISDGSSGASFAYYTNGTFGNNEYSCMTLNTIGTGSSGVGVSVRSTNTGHNRYEAIAYPFGITISTVQSGSVTQLLGFTAVTAGHEYEYCLRAVGTTISITDNGTTIETVTDSTNTTGPAGISFDGGSGAAGKLCEQGVSNAETSRPPQLLAYLLYYLMRRGPRTGPSVLMVTRSLLESPPATWCD